MGVATSIKMASTLCRAIAGVTRRAILYPSVTKVRTCVSGGPTDYEFNFEGKVELLDSKMPNALGHVVGLERYEMLQNLKGNYDPWDFNTHLLDRNEGTRDNPVMVPAAAPERYVGCLCDDTVMSIAWMELRDGEPRRCQCGFWFKLQKVDNMQDF